MSVLSWNIQGLNETNFQSRIEGIYYEICQKKPDVLLLQEVVSKSYMFLKKKLGKAYSFFLHANSEPLNAKQLDSYRNKSYYNVIGVSTYAFTNVKSMHYSFPNSSMGRHFICCYLELIDQKNIPLLVCSTHLESLNQNSQKRIDQSRLEVDELVEQELNGESPLDQKFNILSQLATTDDLRVKAYAYRTLCNVSFRSEFNDKIEELTILSQNTIDKELSSTHHPSKYLALLNSNLVLSNFYCGNVIMFRYLLALMDIETHKLMDDNNYILL
uniref:Tyrosyl-DNA phosphodiesterase 2-like n=1 Tax=Dermatophagoides pteronyssinus TaxID=6956 RepID=A0A6P6Y9Z5_DERPT|nr:tyrosyl-DNA phosphodiesterase 2-like [Dermatophagoides pteronyssinus]